MPFLRLLPHCSRTYAGIRDAKGRWLAVLPSSYFRLSISLPKYFFNLVMPFASVTPKNSEIRSYRLCNINSLLPLSFTKCS